MPWEPRKKYAVGNRVKKIKQRTTNICGTALRLATDGQKIFLEAGTYTVSAGASKSLSSYFVFGKNLSLIGASTRDCILLYKKEDADDEASRPKLETFLICAGSGTPTFIKRLTFRNGNPSFVKTKFFGVGGGCVQIEVPKIYYGKS